MLKRTSMAVAKAQRHDDLKTILQSRRLELARDVLGRLRDVRIDGIGDRGGLDEAEASDVDIQDDIEFALIQLKAETLTKIETALHRIEEGDYGDCFECGGEIAEARLRAIPFAVRCRDCEAVREATDRRERRMADRGPAPLFVDASAVRHQ